MTTLDRQTKTWALLTLPNGDAYDAVGSTWEEIKANAEETATALGITIDAYNPETPEA